MHWRARSILYFSRRRRPVLKPQPCNMETEAGVSSLATIHKHRLRTQPSPFKVGTTLRSSPESQHFQLRILSPPWHLVSSLYPACRRRIFPSTSPLASTRPEQSARF